MKELTAQAVSKRDEDKAVLLKVDPPQLLSFSDRSRLSGQADAPENYRVVPFSRAPECKQTEVTLGQSNLMGGVTSSGPVHWADHENSWASVLKRS